jgi:Ca2+-binding RTX toxin-like protein
MVAREATSWSAAGPEPFDGGSGNDLLIGRAGVNHMNGGAGDDTFVNTGGLNIDNGGFGNDSSSTSAASCRQRRVGQRCS